MATSTWKMRYQDSGGTWSTQYSISNPTNDITIDMNSTRQKHKLYDGSLGRTVPTTKYNYSEVDLDWAFISGGNALLQVSAAHASSISLHMVMSAGHKVEFTTHSVVSIDSGTTTSQVWQGYLTGYPRLFKLGQYPAASGYATFYDLSVSIDITSLA